MWLPNEPRGSWSDFVASYELFQFGPATKTTTRRSVARCTFDRQIKHRMQSALTHQPVRLTGEQARLAARSIIKTGYPVYALAVLPDHVHAVIGRIDRTIRRAVGHMKSEATRSLRSAGHFIDRPVWADHGWNVFLDDTIDIERSIAYVNDNPTKQGLSPQHWSGLSQAAWR